MSVIILIVKVCSKDGSRKVLYSRVVENDGMSLISTC